MDTGLILIVGVLGITVYYILTDSLKKTNTDKPEETSTEKEEPKVNEVKRTTKQTDNVSDPDVLVQGNSYNPATATNHTEQKIKSVTTTTTVYETEEYVSIRCNYCDTLVKVPKGGSIPCTCCGAIISDTTKGIDENEV